MARTRGCAEIVERTAGECEELVLIQRDEHYEVVANGMFLMDTRGGTSERLLVTAAADRMPSPGRMLIAGLGVGFSLAAALAHPAVSHVQVVEREPAVLRWNRGVLAHVHCDALRNPRACTCEADVVIWLTTAAPASLDAICLDVDNGPDWLVTPDNRWLYSEDGLRAAGRVLSPNGVLAVWSAHRSPVFASRIADHFSETQVLETPVARGEPDVIILGRQPTRLPVTKRNRDAQGRHDRGHTVGLPGRRELASSALQMARYPLDQEHLPQQIQVATHGSVWEADVAAQRAGNE